MNRRILLAGLAATYVACAAGWCAPVLAANAGPWINNGSSACARFLTADVTAAILTVPATPVAALDATSCHAGGIYITLKVQSAAVFRMELPQIVGVNLIAGIGDVAYWNHAGALSSAKGSDRGCDISVIGAPTRVKDGELGAKLGVICNKLFALN